MENKPFFTKYIAVEGQIKPGETGISVNNATYTHQPHLPDDYGKPAKLFLCSRDIKMDDKEIYVHKPDGSDATKVELVYLIADGTTTALKVKHPDLGEFATLIQNSFKAIGEISPEATWITEGMTFSEEEVRYGAYKKRNFGEGWLVTDSPRDEWMKMSEDTLSLNKWHKCILIKCPTCGKFH